MKAKGLFASAAVLIFGFGFLSSDGSQSRPKLPSSRNLRSPKTPYPTTGIPRSTPTSSSTSTTGAAHFPTRDMEV